jgi:hypothetical protein
LQQLDKAVASRLLILVTDLGRFQLQLCPPDLPINLIVLRLALFLNQRRVRLLRLRLRKRLERLTKAVLKRASHLKRCGRKQYNLTDERQDLRQLRGGRESLSQKLSNRGDELKSPFLFVSRLRCARR